MNQNLGRALFAMGYTRVLAVMHPDDTHNDRWHKLFRFDPVAEEDSNPNAMTAEEIQARWGYENRLVAGTAGEGGQIKDPTPDVLEALLLPPGYRWTDMDLADAGKLTRNGTQWACDDTSNPIGIGAVIVPPPPPPPPVDPPVDPPHVCPKLWDLLSDRDRRDIEKIRSWPRGSWGSAKVDGVVNLIERLWATKP